MRSLFTKTSVVTYVRLKWRTVERSLFFRQEMCNSAQTNQIGKTCQLRLLLSCGNQHLNHHLQCKQINKFYQIPFYNLSLQRVIKTKNI